jgi:hypothetical protein
MGNYPLVLQAWWEFPLMASPATRDGKGSTLELFQRRVLDVSFDEVITVVD